MSTYYKAGAWNCICQVCGFQFKSDEIIRRWDGRLVCKEDYEPRHSLDLIRPPQERPPVPFTSPEPADEFVTVIYVFAELGLADVAQADIGKTEYINQAILNLLQG